MTRRRRDVLFREDSRRTYRRLITSSQLAPVSAPGASPAPPAPPLPLPRPRPVLRRIVPFDGRFALLVDGAAFDLSRRRRGGGGARVARRGRRERERVPTRGGLGDVHDRDDAVRLVGALEDDLRLAVEVREVARRAALNTCDTDAAPRRSRVSSPGVALASALFPAAAPAGEDRSPSSRVVSALRSRADSFAAILAAVCAASNVPSLYSTFAEDAAAASWWYWRTCRRWQYSYVHQPSMR